MLVIAETPQLEMGPYVAVAEARLALYSWAAVLREAVSVKVYGGGEAGGEGGGAHAPKPLQEAYAEEKAALPAHAQEIMALLPSDRDGVSCQVKRAYPLGEGVCLRRRRR